MPGPFERLFYASHGFSPQGPRALTDDLADRLVSVALGRTPDPNRARALELLAAARHPESTRVLARVLDDRREDPALRAVAAARLGDAGGAEAERVLIDAVLAPGDEVVGARAAAALARSGTGEALGALRDAAAGEGPAARLARYASLLIAHREGISGYEVPPPAELLPPPARGEPFRVVPVRERDAQAILALPPGRRFGTEVATRGGGYRIRCGPNRMILALNAAQVRDDPARRAQEQPLLAGAVFLQSPEDGSFSVWRTVVAGPREKGFYVAVHRTDGTLTHYGEGTARGEGGEVQLRSTNVVGNVAVAATVRVSERGLEFVRAESAVRVVGSGSPVRLGPGRRA